MLLTKSGRSIATIHWQCPTRQSPIQEVSMRVNNIECVFGSLQEHTQCKIASSRCSRLVDTSPGLQESPERRRIQVQGCAECGISSASHRIRVFWGLPCAFICDCFREFNDILGLISSISHYSLPVQAIFVIVSACCWSKLTHLTRISHCWFHGPVLSL